MGIATVRGAFRSFEGSIDATDRPVLRGTVQVDSVDTGDEQRDGHLKAPDFFDVERHPEISFHTTAIEAAEDGRIRLVGEITIKGIDQADRTDRHRRPRAAPIRGATSASASRSRA